jgi:hypothetical protein
MGEHDLYGWNMFGFSSITSYCHFLYLSLPRALEFAHMFPFTWLWLWLGSLHKQACLLRSYLLLSSHKTTMAIHSEYPGLKAEIVIAGEALEEYDDDGEPQPKTTTKYIEARSGEHSGVRYTIPSSFFDNYGVKATIRIDGEDMHKSLFFHVKYKRCGVHNIFTSTSAAVVDGKTKDQKFRFSELSRCKVCFLAVTI